MTLKHVQIMQITTLILGSEMVRSRNFDAERWRNNQIEESGMKQKVVAMRFSIA